MNDVKEDIGALATEAMNLLIEAVEQIPAESWDQPSNLDGWSLRELVGHALGSATKIVTLVEGGKIWGRSEPADWVSEDPAARLRELAARLQEVLPGADLDAPRVSPAGEVPLQRALAFPISDVALHSWDLHRSQGRLIELPENLLMVPGAGGVDPRRGAAAAWCVRGGATRTRERDADCAVDGPSRALR